MFEVVININKFNYDCTNVRINFQSSRSLIWIKDLLLHINPHIRHLGISYYLLSFNENEHTKPLLLDEHTIHSRYYL